MKNDQPIVFVIDDEEQVRKSLALLLRSVGIAVETFGTADAFLQDWNPDRSGCVVLDIRLPGMSGLELQEHLSAQDAMVPIIFITGHGDVSSAVRAMRQGAFHFLEKPFSDQELLDNIHRALEQDQRNRSAGEKRAAVQARLDLLTPREREVMDLVLRGKTNKLIALELGISERTIEIHRSRMMFKMGASSLAQLVKMGFRILDEGTHVS